MSLHDAQYKTSTCKMSPHDAQYKTSTLYSTCKTLVLLYKLYQTKLHCTVYKKKKKEDIII